jgi:hypothetical protein
MSRNFDRQESMRIAAEKVRLKKEREEKEDREFYTRITSGPMWTFFKVIVVFCTLLSVVTFVEEFVDGSTKKMSETSWEINRDWEYTWHKVLEVDGCLFTPTIIDWADRKENSLKMTYSPIFKTPKKLSFDVQINEFSIRKQEEIRWRSIFEWFPAFQLFLLIPLITFLFKRQSAWFNFARIASLVIVFPGALMVIFFTLL